jgi:RimJ/RimL family protein N-acetyltransferase
MVPPVTFKLSDDYALIRSILCEPRAWRRMVDDDAPPAFGAIHRCARVEYVIARDGGAAVAVFLIVDGNEIHFCFTPASWGKTEAIACGFLAWVWTHLPATCLYGPVPSYNRLALRLAKKVGFLETGRRSNVLTKGGREYDLVQTEIRKP